MFGVGSAAGEAPTPAGAATVEVPWLLRLEQSPLYAEQIRTAGLDRAETLRLRHLLEVLHASDGTLHLSAVGRVLMMAHPEMAEFIPRLERALNAEGYRVLTLRLDSGTLTLDAGLLQRVFLGVVRSDPNEVSVETPQGERVRFSLPFEPTRDERAVLEALVRFVRMSEGELSRLTGIRRLAGVLGKVTARLGLAGLGFLVYACTVGVGTCANWLAPVPAIDP